MTELKFKDWIFLVDIEKTINEYSKFKISGAESCLCNECKNYVVFREKVFPKSIIELFLNLGIDFKKEVEITYLERLENDLHYIGGWFHFKGKILKGKKCNEPLPYENGSILSLEKVEENFSIGFDEGKDLTFFENQNDLIQLEFSTNIPWVIEKELESKN